MHIVNARYTFCSVIPIVWSKLSQYCFFSTRNLNELLEIMPKQNKHTTVLQKQRQKLKEKGQKYIPGTVTIKVLGSGARGAPRSLYVFTDQSRYLFNCGEGTQRLAHEHKMKLSKLEHIFITYPSWENIGGLPGVALTIQDVGVPEITIHGPSGTNEIFAATRRFVILRDLCVRMSDCAEGGHFEDNVMVVHYVPIKSNKMGELACAIASTAEAASEDGKKSPRMQSPFRSDTESEDEVDYYAHERKTKRGNSSDRKRKRVRKNSQSPGKQPIPKDPALSMGYICQLRARPGMLCLERCVEKGVPPGPLLGKLKAGEDVTLESGEVVKSTDVRLPDDPGPIFIVVDCPSLDYVDSLVNNPIFSQHQSTAERDEDVAHLVVHFTPNSVMEDSRYQAWMEKFMPSTHHLILNEENSCMGSVAVHRIQHKLHMLHPKIFPLLQDFGIPTEPSQEDVESPPNCETTDVRTHESVVKNGFKNVNDIMLRESMEIVNNSNDVEMNDASKRKLVSNVSLVRGKTFCSVHLRPRKTLDRHGELTLNPKLFVEETINVEGFPESLKELQQRLQAFPSLNDSQKSYPYVVFLGTGSCIPNKTRNTSGILLHISDSDCILLDCGEGTYGQLVRFYGYDEIDKVLCKLRAVYISHLHADHHIGLIGVLKGRCHALNKEASVHQPVFLLAPKQIMSWLSLYHSRFEPILQELELIPNADLDLGGHKLAPVTSSHFLKALGMVDISTVPVRHCPNAFGVALQHQDNWKITYSGDTMPCPQLIELGRGSDLLIHEATMEDELEGEARSKLHSTTSQAIEVGQSMNAKFTVLTHFSQRYAKLPRFNDNFTSNVGIAFDNMQVCLNDLPLLPLLYPSLKLMFAEHYEELEQKAARRLMKQEREREHNST